MTDEFAQVKKALSQLPGVIQEKVVVGATRAAAKVIADEAKKNVPVDTGLLKKTIGVAKAKKKDTQNGHVKFYVVPKSKNYIHMVFKHKKVDISKMRFSTMVFYAHMVEFGTSKMEARPFMRPAYLNSADSSVKAFQDYAMKHIDKEVTKLAK